MSLRSLVPDSLTGTSLAISTVGLLGFYVVATIIYRIYLHPLARFRGPFLGKFSEYDSWGSILTQDRSLRQYDFLRHYGSPVRMSTNTLVYSDAKSWSDIYGQSSEPCPKDGGFYDVLTVTGAPNLVSVTDRAGHARLRRLLSHSFSERALLESESLIMDKVDDYVEYVYGGARPGETVEIVRRTHDHYLDIVSHLSFGRSFNCMRGDYPTAFDDLNEFSNVLVPTALFSKTFFPALGFLLAPWLRENLKGLNRLEQFGRAATTEFLRTFDEKGAEKLPRTFLLNLVTAQDTETGTQLSPDELVENAIIFLRAGSSTTAVTTLYCVWAGTKHPEVSRKLVAEIREAFPDPSERPTYAKASKLTYLDCVIQETFRLFGTLNVSLPRVSPGRMISGQFIPAGTVVQTNPYATARDPDVFPHPDDFVPERWLSPSAEMRAMSRPFSWGPRNCIGKHMAEIGLYLTLSRLYQLFDVALDPRTTDEMMQPKDIGVMEPKGEHLYLQVKRRV